MSGGLVGFTKGAFRVFENSLVRIFVFFVVGAAAISVVETTLAKATTSLSFWKLLFLGFGCIMAELMGTHRAITAWWEAKPGSMIAWSGVWLFGFCFALYMALGSAANFQAQREGVQKAAFRTQTSAADMLKSAKAKRDRIEAELSLMSVTVNGEKRPPRTAEAAQADLDNALSHKFWRSTSGCTETKGPQTREFCGNIAAWKAEKSLAGSKLTKEAELDAVRTEVIKYEAELKSTPALATSEHTPFVALVSTMTPVKAETAALIEPIQSSLTNMMLCSLAGVVMALGSLAGSQRRRWFDFRGAYRRAVSIVTGNDPGPSLGGGDTLNVTVSDERALHALNAKLRDMARALPSGQVAA